MLFLKYRYLFDRYIIKREYIGEYKVEGNGLYKSSSCMRIKRGENHPINLL